MKTCLRIALALTVFNSIALTSAVQADDQSVVRQSRVRTVDPSPHRRVICLDRSGWQIPCADSARVARQLIHDGACDGCTPSIGLSRYGARPWWWVW